MASLRRLSHPDRAPWAELRHALWPETERATLEGELDAILASPDQVALGLFEGDALIGMAEASIREYGEGCVTAPVAWLEGIYLTPAHRRAGHAGTLVAAIEEWALAKGMSELGSDAELDNLASIAAHAQWGFSETKRIVTFRKALK